MTTPLVISMSAHGANSMGVGASISAHREAPSSLQTVHQHQCHGPSIMVKLAVPVHGHSTVTAGTLLGTGALVTSTPIGVVLPQLGAFWVLL